MIEKLQENWDEVLLYMKEEHEIMDISFKTWLLPLKVHHVDQNTATIVVPDSNMIGYIRKKYGLPLEVSIAEKLGFECKLNFISKEEAESSAPPIENLLIKKNSKEVSPEVIQSANLNPKYTFDTFVVGANNN